MDTCPNCGADLPDDPTACPECGSCEETGWSERARYDNLGIPFDDEEEIDYAAVFDDDRNADSRVSGARLIYALAAIILILVFLFLAL